MSLPTPDDTDHVCPVCLESVGNYGFACFRHRGHPQCVIDFYRRMSAPNSYICPFRCPGPNPPPSVRLQRRHGVRNVGFNRQIAISAELADFCGCQPTDLMSRIDVMRCLSMYILDNHLQDPDNPRRIIPDARLILLLDHDADGPPLTFLNMASYVRRHYVG